MARVPVQIYKKSPEATAMSIIGAVLLVLAVVIIRGGGDAAVAIVLFAIGAMLEWLAVFLNERKTYMRWMEWIQKHDLEKNIAASVDVAVQVWRINPTKKAQQYIMSLNPQAGEIIKAALAKKKK